MLRRSLNVGTVITLVLVSFASVAAVAYRERVTFVGKCWNNGNQLSECWCTFSALSELPENYRNVAISWAHDSATDYAASVMKLVLAEALDHSFRNTLKAGDLKERKTRLEAWTRRVGASMGWAALKAAAPKIAGTFATAAVLAPIAYEAGAEFVRARSTLDRHCAKHKTFLVRIDETRQAVERAAKEIASDTATIVVEAGAATMQTTATATERLWRWVKSWVSD